ncbi:hypothetical protein P7H06_25515 [Paenibacillus larvae]|nr:hypothetical protein [Paenibacillus larvae]MDT2262176.1 hypothetical protein [Paenibacillus larvae]
MTICYFTVSILSGIDVEELENEAGIDEIVDYIASMYTSTTILTT